MRLSRRMVLAGAACLPLAEGVEAASLQKVAGRANMMFGAAVQARQILADAPFREQVVRQCGTIIPEIEMKWDFIEPEAGRFNMQPADQLAEFAASHGKAMHGHALLWHRSIAPWAVQHLTENADWSILRKFMEMVVPRYARNIGSWDVVNEPLEIGPRKDGLRNNVFLAAFGTDYIRRAFEEARELAPDAVLFLNEYGLLEDFPESVSKREALIRLLEALLKAGAPVGGVGIQAHLELAKTPHFDAPAITDLFNRIGAMGLQIRISELDVTEAETALPVEMRDAKVAEAVTRLLEAVIENRAVGSINCWGLSDRYSWLPPQSALAGPNRGLPLDARLRPKAMYRVIRNHLTLRRRIRTD